MLSLCHVDEKLLWGQVVLSKERRERKKLKMIYVTINFNYNARVYSIIDEEKSTHLLYTLDTFDISSGGVAKEELARSNNDNLEGGVGEKELMSMRNLTHIY
jgi:hypothetical protein